MPEPAGEGHAETMDALLEGGASLDQPDSDGATPLMHACSCSSTAAVMRLLAAGASVNAADAGGEHNPHARRHVCGFRTTHLIAEVSRHGDCAALLNEVAVACRCCIRAERLSQLELARTLQQEWCARPEIS